LLARSVQAAWGEPARPGLPPEGETGKGVFKDSLLPQAIHRSAPWVCSMLRDIGACLVHPAGEF